MGRLQDEKPAYYSSIARKMKQHDSVTLFDPNDVTVFLHALHRHNKDGEVIKQGDAYLLVCSTE